MGAIDAELTSLIPTIARCFWCQKMSFSRCRFDSIRVLWMKALSIGTSCLALVVCAYDVSYRHVATVVARARSSRRVTTCLCLCTFTVQT